MTRLSRRQFATRLSGAAALVATCVSLIGCATVAGGKAVGRPVVLVHGAWMGASSWDRVAAELRGQGLQVTVVELPGHGQDTTPADKLSLQGYVQAVVKALPADGKATLVGHSMAGMVISLVAEQAPLRVANLVYVAAYLPQRGESLYKIATTDTDNRVGKYWTQVDPKAYSPAWIKPEGIAEVFCADCSEADKQMLVQTHKAEAIAPMATPVTLSAVNFGRVPRIYVHTLKDNAVSYKLQKGMLAKAGGAAKVVALDTSHAPMLTQPKALAAAIADAAKS